MKILYNLASRSRPEKFFETLDNLREMSAFTYIVLAKLDKDDADMYNDQVMHMLRKYPEVCVKWGLSKSKIDAINRDLKDSTLLNEIGIIINLSDDQRFTRQDFDHIIRKHMPDDLDGFVHFPDQYAKASVSTMSIIGKKYFERTGAIYNDEYYSLFADLEETQKAKLLGKYIFVNEQIFEHRHFTAGLSEKDDLYKRNNSFRLDEIIYQQRRRRNFDLDIPKDPFLLIKYATRGRWRMFFEAIENIYATISTDNFKIIVSADLDDVEMNCPETREMIRRYQNVELHYGPAVSKIHAINRDMGTQAWDWCVVMSDDMKFITPGWDKKMLESVKKIWPDTWDWFAHFSDGYVKEKLPTLNICGREWYDRFGYIYHPEYKSVSCDAENMYVAMMEGRYHYFPEVYFHHLHPANLKQPSDQLLRRNHAFGDMDTDVYFKRLKRYFDVKEPVLVPEEMKPFL